MLETSSAPREPQGDLFATLQAMQATTQAQVERFHHQMVLVKTLAGQVRGEAQLKLLGDISLSLHQVHALLFGATAPAATAPAPAAAPAATTPPVTASAASALEEFALLVAAGRSTARHVTTMLAQTEEHLELLQAASSATA